MEKRCIITTKIKYVNWEKILLLLISYGALLWGSGQIINIIKIPLLYKVLLQESIILFIILIINKQYLKQTILYKRTSFINIYTLWILLFFSIAIWLGISVNTPIYTASILILSALLVGVTEEYIFRGLFFPLLSKGSVKNGILFSTLIFSMWHILNINTSSIVTLLGQLLFTLGFGAFLAVVYLTKKNIIIPMLLHGTYNSISFIVTIPGKTESNNNIPILPIFLGLIFLIFAIYTYIRNKNTNLNFI